MRGGRLPSTRSGVLVHHDAWRTRRYARHGTLAAVDLSGWTLAAWPGHKVKRQKEGMTVELGSVLGEHRILSPGESVAVKVVPPSKLANMGGTIALYDGEKRQIDRVK